MTKMFPCLLYVFKFEYVSVLPVVYLALSLCELSWQSLLPTGSVFLLQQAAVQAAFQSLLCCHELEAKTEKHRYLRTVSVVCLQQFYSVCVSTWMCTSDKRLLSSSPSLLWFVWMRFLTCETWCEILTKPQWIITSAQTTVNKVGLQ